MSRRIYIVGEINEESYQKFSERLAELEAEDPIDDVEIELASEGGFAYAALAFYARMRLCPCDIIVRAYGFVASAATLILAAGDNRIIARESWVMVHEDQGEHEGSVSDIEKKIAHDRRMEEQWLDLMVELTKGKVSRSYLQSIHEETTYLSAEEALEIGLVDEVV